jgi:hypothetical protein
VVFLGTSVPRAVSQIISYSGYVGDWTWSGTWVMLGHRGAGYNSPLSGLASLFIVPSVAAILWLLRRHPPEARALGGLAAVLVCTAGFGTQYLFWVLPLAIALSARWRNQYVIAASAWAALFYLTPSATTGSRDYLIGLSWLPAAVLVAIIAEQVRSRPGELASGPGLPAADDLVTSSLRRPELVPTPAAAVSRTGRPDKDARAAG